MERNRKLNVSVLVTNRKSRILAFASLLFLIASFSTQSIFTNPDCFNFPNDLVISSTENTQNLDYLSTVTTPSVNKAQIKRAGVQKQIVVPVEKTFSHNWTFVKTGLHKTLTILFQNKLFQIMLFLQTLP